VEVARSAAYDEWEDVGLAFTDQEVAVFSTQLWAETHLKELCDVVRVLLRRTQLPNMVKPKWQEQALKMMQGRVTWCSVAGDLPAVDMEAVCALPDPKTAEGKLLTQRALAAEPEAYLASVRTHWSGLVTWYVTISRRAASVQSWKKAEHSRSNKVANAALGDIRTIDKLIGLLESLPSAK
jgi:hypothetical protein